MDGFFRFLFDFLSQFFNGFKLIFQGIVNGFVTIFNIPEYIKIVRDYSSEFSGGMWILVVLSVVLVLVISHLTNSYQ